MCCRFMQLTLQAGTPSRKQTYTLLFRSQLVYTGTRTSAESQKQTISLSLEAGRPSPYLEGSREPPCICDTEHQAGRTCALQKVPKGLPVVFALQVLAPRLLWERQSLAQAAAQEAHTRVQDETLRSPCRRRLLVLLVLLLRGTQTQHSPFFLGCHLVTARGVLARILRVVHHGGPLRSQSWRPRLCAQL